LAGEPFAPHSVVAFSSADKLAVRNTLTKWTAGFRCPFCRRGKKGRA
jgi:hypothetical protein